MEVVTTLVLLALLSTAIKADDLQVEYFKDISLGCDPSNHNFSQEDIENRYWMLPDGRLVDRSSNDPRISLGRNYTLNISRVDDIDFGLYSCLLLFKNHTMASIQHGVNMDGPYFGDLLSKYKKNAMIGGIAAGSLFVVLAGGCILWNLRFHKRSERNKAVDALDKAIDGYDLKSYDNVGVDPENGVTVLDEKARDIAQL